MFFFFFDPNNLVQRPDRLYLREYRKLHRRTLKEISEFLGIHLTAIQKWETHKAFPPIPSLIKLSDEYKIHVAALFFDPTKSESRPVLELLAESRKHIDMALFLARNSGELGAEEKISPELKEEFFRLRNHSTIGSVLVKTSELVRAEKIISSLPTSWIETWLNLAEDTIAERSKKHEDTTSLHTSPSILIDLDPIEREK
jgi:transcriptional regulator with XRE-family HTH domain